MAFTSVTNTFTNGSTADATQVNQNFTDILNGLSDTTKDFSMNNGTLASTLTANGNVVLGSSSSKTIMVNGSIASSVPVNANNSWDLGGSGLGFKSIYIGASGGFTTRIITAATASWTLTLPPTAGSNLQILTTDGTGVATWQNNFTDPSARQNYGISTSVATNAMTVSLLGANGSNPSATNPVNINFRNATAATGTPVFVQCTGALSVVIASGATLGTASGVNSYVYLYAINNAGTIELAVAGNNVIDEGTIQNTTAMSGSATSNAVLYGTSGRSNVAVRLLGRILVNETVAGTWALNSTEIALAPFPPSLTGLVCAAHVAAWTGGSPSGEWGSSSGTTMGAFNTNTSAPANTIDINNTALGVALTTNSNLPQITINNLAIGKYKVTAQFAVDVSNGSAQQQTYAINDGTTTSGNQTFLYAVGSTLPPMMVIGYFQYAAAANRTFAVWGQSTAGSAQIYNFANTGQSPQLNWSIEKVG